MYRIILFVVGFNCLAAICRAQDSITVNDVKVIKTRSEIIIDRYLNNLLNTISYSGAESTEIRDLISQSVEDSEKRIFLNGQIAVADDVSDPDYTNASNAPEVPVVRYLNAFNTFYRKSDTNSVYFSDIRSSPVKKGRHNIYINVYFTSLFKNASLSKPSTPFQPAKRVAEIFIKRSSNNKWLFYISRIGFYNPADTVNDVVDNIAIIAGSKQTNTIGQTGEITEAPETLGQYITQAHLEENKRNYREAIRLYSKAIALAPDQRHTYEARITELSTYLTILADPEEKYKAGDYNGAVKAYSDLLRIPASNSDYSNSDYYLGRAKCYDKMGQLSKSYNRQIEYYNKALKDYDKSYEYDKNNVETIRLRADLRTRMGKNR